MGEKNAVQVNSLLCASAGYCKAGGRYRDGSGHFQAFVVTEQNGAWGRAIRVPGSACSTRVGLPASPRWRARRPGCGAGGFYSDGSHQAQAMVVSRT